MTQTITFEARVNGRLVPGVLEVQSSAGEDQINSECTIWCLARPDWADERQSAEIYATNSATISGWLFRGEVTGFNWTFAPTKVGIVCADMLARTREAWGGDDYDYTSQTSDAIVRNGLEKKAIPSSMAHIEGSGWVVGVITPLTLKSGDDVYATLIQPLDDLEGYRTYSLSSGVIVRMRVIGAIGGASLSVSEGVEILAAPTRARTALGMVNRAIFTGVDYEGLTVGGPGIGEASAPNPYVTDPSGFVTERVQSNLIEDDPTALLFAQQRVSDKNRRPESGAFRMPLDPRVQPGMGLAVAQPGLELSGVTVRIKHVSHTINAGGAITEVRWAGGSLTGTSLLAPVANFTIEAIAEAEDTGAGITPLIVLICDGSGSFDPDGTIVSYAWSVTTDGTAAPDSGSGAVLRSVLTGATTVTVTLTVTDNDSQTGTLALTQALDPSTLPTEDLYLAFGTASVSVDGELTWRDVTPASGAATCLMPLAPAWGQLWGTTTGHLYATFDSLATALVDLGQPHGAVACTAVWVHETDTTRLWAGFSDGAVWRGTLDIGAQVATWAHAGTVPDSPIVEVRESVGTLNELRATAGAGVYASADGGATWALAHTFDTAWRMAAGFDSNLASGLNDSAPLYDEDGVPPTVPGGVTHIRGLSFGWRQSELYAADDAGALYLGAGPSFDLTLSADTTPAQVNHMIRSGNVDRVVYMAVGDGSGDNGFVKWIPDAAVPFFVRRTGSDAGLMVGYGPLHIPPPRGCVTVHVPTDPGTANYSSGGSTYGRITMAGQSFNARFSGGATVESAIDLLMSFGPITYHLAANTPITADALLAAMGILPQYMDSYTPHDTFTVDFCNLAPG